MLRLTVMVLIAYCLTLTATLIACLVGLTTMKCRYVFHYMAVVIPGTLFFILIISKRKKITGSFIRLMFFAQYLMFLTIYTLWVYHLNEIRLMGLFCTLIALTFVFINTDLIQSLFIAMGTLFIQVTVSYYAIRIAGQEGSFYRELFYAITLFPSFIFISLVAKQIKLQRIQFKEMNRELEDKNRKLSDANAALMREQEFNVKELGLASKIQTSLFPQEPFESDIWDVAYEFRPRFGVSGDFFDFYYREGRLKGISIFDVTGHGVSSALITILARPVFQRAFRKRSDESLADVVEKANRNLSEQMQEMDMYISGILLSFFDDTVEYVNAGHPDLLHRRAESGSVDIIQAGDSIFRGSPVGIYGVGDPCRPYYFTVKTGDVLLLTTDGFLEGNNTRGDNFGIERATLSLHNAPGETARDILDHIMNQFYSFVDQANIRDDITVILARKKALNGPEIRYQKRL